MAWERARTEVQKAQRISDIINATARLYQRQRFDEITFASIAKEAGFTRSNLYKYFNSKAEIFFEFLKADIRRWRRDLLQCFDSAKTYDPGEFAAIWSNVLRNHGRLLDLIAILYAYLEKGSSIESVIDFKRRANQELSCLAELLRQLFPTLSRDQALTFLNMQLAAAIGLHTMTHLSDTQKRVLAMPEFEHFKLDFGTYFESSLAYLIQGLLNDSDAAPP